MSSDEEGTRGGRAADDDVALPKATVNKLIQGELSLSPIPLVVALTIMRTLQNSFHPVSPLQKKLKI